AFAAFTSAGKTFSIAFPSGWGTPVVDDAGNVQSNAAGNPNQAWCRANSNRMPSLDGVTQQKLNSDYVAPLDAATWASVLSIDATKMTLLERSSLLVDGHVVQYATLALDPAVLGQKATGRFVSHILVGRMVNAACFAAGDSYDAMKATFEAAINSLKP